MTKNSEPEKVSFWDTFNSMTGYEEEAVEKAFGVEPGELVQKTFNGTLSFAGMRAMAFILALRAGDADPKATVMAKTRVELNDQFLSDLEDAEDAMPEEPDTELGKADSPAE